MSFTMKDTGALQGMSLVNFMQQLGYAPAWTESEDATQVNKPRGWNTRNKNLKHVSHVSHSTAIKLHNLDRKDWVTLQAGWYSPLGMEHMFAVNEYALNMLMASKLVTQVKFQPKRHSYEGIQLQSHMVEFTNPAYPAVFGFE